MVLPPVVILDPTKKNYWGLETAKQQFAASSMAAHSLFNGECSLFRLRPAKRAMRPESSETRSADSATLWTFDLGGVAPSLVYPVVKTSHKRHIVRKNPSI